RRARWSAEGRRGVVRVRFAGPISCTTTTWWSDHLAVSRGPGSGTISCHLLVQAADLAVPQPVVDQGQQFPGARDVGRVLGRGARPVDDALIGAAHGGAGRGVLDRLDRGPAHQS